MSFEIATIDAGTGALGICPAPGRYGGYATDFGTILEWAPRLVFTMTEQPELDRLGAGAFGEDLAQVGIGWVHLPIRDFGAPQGATLSQWSEASGRARAVLNAGGRVLIHCYGGCGRSGMALLRLLVEMGEEVEVALTRLRAARPCAIETDAQMAWARLSNGAQP